MNKRSNISRKTLGRILAVTVSLVVSLAVIQLASFYYFFEFESDAVMREMGFGFIDAYPKVDGEYLDYVAIGYLQKSGELYQAGFRDGEILLDYPTGLSARALFTYKLATNRGKELAIRVVDSGDGPPLSQRPSRTIRFVVP